MVFWRKKPQEQPSPKRATEDETEALLRIVRRVMAMIVIADGDVEEEELEAFRVAYHKICGRELTLAQVKTEVRLTDGDTHVERFLIKARDKLDAEDKAIILRAALAVANADGEIAGSEDELLDRIVKALAMSDADARRVLESA